MRTKLAVGIFLAVLGGFGLWLWATREPSYGGKPLSVWIRLLHYENLNPTDETRTALRAMGDPAVKSLIATLQRHDSRPKKWFLAYARNHSDVYNFFVARQHVVPERVYHSQAATALGEIGPTANSAIPALTEATKDPDGIVSDRARAALMKIRQEPIEPLLRVLEGPHTKDWFRAASVIKYLGTNGQPAVPHLVNAIQDTNAVVREVAVNALGGVASSPEITIPALIGCLKDPAISRNAIDALTKFKEAKEQVAPILLRIMQDRNNQNYNLWLGASHALEMMLSAEEIKKLYVPALIESLQNNSPINRENAALFLKRVDPEAAANAGVK